MSGILNVNKAPGPTSFDVVRLVRKGSGEKRIGHAGTLDPAARGVLLILVGQAVRVSEYLMDLPKVYQAHIRLGVTTDSYDAMGEVLARNDSPLEEAQLREALKSFVGEIQQVPPPFSAVKVDGERAYTRARRGERVSLRQRPVNVYRAEVTGFSYPTADIEVECGRGTYIRSLAHNLGQALGSGAHLAGLTRTRVGPFRIERSVDLEALESALANGSWEELLEPVDCGLLALPQLTFPIEDERDLRHGRAVTLDQLLAQAPRMPDATDARAYAEDGSFIGLVRYDAESGRWRPRKIFAPERGRIVL